MKQDLLPRFVQSISSMNYSCTTGLCSNTTTDNTSYQLYTAKSQDYHVRLCTQFATLVHYGFNKILVFIMSRKSMTQCQKREALLLSSVLKLCLKFFCVFCVRFTPSSTWYCATVSGTVCTRNVVNCQPCAVGPEKPEGHLPPQVLQLPLRTEPV